MIGLSNFLPLCKRKPVVIDRALENCSQMSNRRAKLACIKHASSNGNEIESPRH